MNLQQITVTVLTKNSQKHLHNVLSALDAFGEVMIYDTGSTDETVQIANSYPNVTLIQAPFIGFGPTHNQASHQAKNDWILSIDSDEILSAEALQEIKELPDEQKAVYSFPRHNYYNGKWIKCCGWYPDRQIKLYHRRQTRFSEDQVHEAVMTHQMQHKLIHAPIYHYPYETIADFLSKMQTYSSLFAKQYQGKRRSSLGKAIRHGLFAFFKSYFLKSGFLGGREGFIISLYNGHTAYYKYLKLKEFNKK